MKLLIVEDEIKIAKSLKSGLLQEGFVVDTAYDGKAGYDLALTEKYDLIILDLMLPEIPGEEICSNLRKNKINTPIIMLTAKGQLQDKLDGFAIGADDYLTKPFAFEELLARINAILKRPGDISENIYKYKNLTLNTRNFEVKKKGKIINLSKKEFQLLEYFMRRSGNIITKEDLISNVWDYDADILPNTVEVFINYLRKKLGRDVIKTVRGFGYKMGEK